MFIQAIAGVFHYKVVASIIVLACWSPLDRMKFNKELMKHGLLATFSCDPAILKHSHEHGLQGVLLMPSEKLNLQKIKSKYFSNWYKWVITEYVPDLANLSRYDSDVVLVKPPKKREQGSNQIIDIYDMYFHPRDGISSHIWGCWTVRGLQILYEFERIQRRRNLMKYPLRIATPMGSYSEEWYQGSFLEYITDMSIPDRDSGVRSGFNGSMLIIEMLNAKAILVPTMLWSTEVNNSSMMLELKTGSSALGGGVLRIMTERVQKLDYVMCLWPFRVGFTYLAERESSSNMFLEPFTARVWWCCLGLFLVLSLAQRVTAKTQNEKEGAFIAVLATTLQQDASAVPEGISGRWSFLVLSMFSMLIHGYYTSAIVSALMSAGRSGPDSLRALGDSKYAIASEAYDYMKYLMFDVKTNWDDLEYLKKKKLTPQFYQDITDGVKLIRGGQTAFHTEYNQLYPHLRSFSDSELCKLQYVDTVPEVLSWITTTKRGEWSGIFKQAGAWLHEAGLSRRLVSLLRLRPPPCRAALLAERVNLRDAAPALAVYAAAVLAALLTMGLEIMIYKWRNGLN